MNLSHGGISKMEVSKATKELAKEYIEWCAGRIEASLNVEGSVWQVPDNDFETFLMEVGELANLPAPKPVIHRKGKS